MRLEVFRRQAAEALVHRLAHRVRTPCRVPARGRSRDSVNISSSRPGADACDGIGADVVCPPARRHRAGELLPVVQREGEIARRVALAAMRERLGQIGAAIPLRRSSSVRARSACPALKTADQIPITQRWSNGNSSVFGRRRRTHRRQVKQVGLDRQRVRIGHVGVGGVRHRRIEPCAVAATPWRTAAMNSASL